MPEMIIMKLDTPDGQLRLFRPGSGGSSLRAWDAADELLLDLAFQKIQLQSHSEAPRVLVVDDQFGALTLGLNRFRPDVVADSALLPKALAHNAGLSAPQSLFIDKSRVFSWLFPPKSRYDAIVMRIPRHSDYLAWLLRWANSALVDNGLLLAGGMIKHLPDKSVKVFADAVKTEEVPPARKKARVVICRRGEPGLQSWPGIWKGYVVGNGGVNIEALPAVFAREKLDIGTRLLLPHVQTAVEGLDTGADVLDLACGNGVLGISALQARGGLAVTFSDASSQAIVSAKHNVARLLPEVRPAFEHADGISGKEGRFERILLNPPFHEGGVVGDHIALRLFAQAAEHLSATGKLLMVGNRHLGYHRSLRRLFPHVRQLDADSRFVVFEAGLNELN